MGGSDKNGALVQIIHGQGSRNPVIHLSVSLCVGGVARPLNGERGVGGKFPRHRRANRSRRRWHHYLAYSRQGRARALKESQGSRRCRRMACGQRAVAAPRQESTGSTGASGSPRARWRSSGCRCRSRAVGRSALCLDSWARRCVAWARTEGTARPFAAQATSCRIRGPRCYLCRLALRRRISCGLSRGSLRRRRQICYR